MFFVWSCENVQPCATCPPSITPPDDTTANPRKLIDSAGSPDWSPTGERIAFVRNSTIYLYYFSDKHIDTITTGTEPNFSPDGKKLTFERNKKVYWIDLTSKQETYLADGITPNWSANGKWIAFANKTASQLLTDGTIVYGEPSSDSSVYYFDLDSAKVKRIVITNYDSLYIGPKLSLFSPVWGMHDSVVFFSGEYGLLKVKITGGKAVHYDFDFPGSQNLRKMISIAQLGNGGQQQWNEATRRLTFFYKDDNGERTYAVIIVYNFNTGYEDGGLIGASDPCWSPEGMKICFYADNSIWVYKLVR